MSNLEDHTSTTKIMIVIAHLGIDQGHTIRPPILAALVVITDDHIHSALLEVGNLLNRGRATIYRNDELRVMSSPKSNGYESLHTTVMGPDGHWVEVQIRTRRMDDIAENGFAAHWKYKEDSSGSNQLDRWLLRIREFLDDPENDSEDFIDSFKMNLFSS